MSRFIARFTEFKNSQNNKPLIGFYTIAEYPNYELCLELLKSMSDQGVAFIELGLPFSDSPVDGPIIQAANNFTLTRGQGKIDQAFRLIKEFRKYDNKIPIVIMGCYNPIYQYGIDNFVTSGIEAGIDAVLIADLPIEEESKVREYSKNKLDLIHLITPLTNEQRFSEIEKLSKGFLYFTSVATITGDKVAHADAIEELVTKFKTKTNLPICVGFGVKTPKIVQDIVKFADGVIIGSILINKINDYLDNNGSLKISKEAFSTEMTKFLRSFLF